ncbi:VOC family protein [Alkalihalophilus lindianensis]|uniref:VOC family protein n=1 Tax=Alkalihalophilus lindianensis TaxID=1630542 RepID=A0ABU3XDV9_9BACI|nr:VOC family protein [Alkalihalophilus lindianensis]MDV2686061.1 VOC family protein [Alkalihalophilus lindianensis]
MELTHTRLLVDQYRECFLFYRDVLGFEVSWGDEQSLYGQFKVGSSQLGLFERKQMVDAVGAYYQDDDTKVDRVALILKVDDVEAKYRELKDKVNFITKPREQADWGLKVVHFRDPDGTLIELYENLL